MLQNLDIEHPINTLTGYRERLQVGTDMDPGIVPVRVAYRQIEGHIKLIREKPLKPDFSCPGIEHHRALIQFQPGGPDKGFDGVLQRIDTPLQGFRKQVECSKIKTCHKKGRLILSSTCWVLPPSTKGERSSLHLSSGRLASVLKVGLTGGIACGKSQFLREFHKLGVYTIDADEIAHRAILPDTSAYQEILNHFGKEILAPDETIDRKKLGQIIFSDEPARQRLNSIVHPRVRQEEARLTSDFEAEEEPESPIIMVDAALMVETGSYRKYDFLIVVYCHPRIQLRRLMSREGFSEEKAMQRIGSQMPLMDKIKYADYIIENSSRLSETHEQVKHVFTELVVHWEDR